MAEMNENDFWEELWKATNEELARQNDPAVPPYLRISVALENVTSKLEPSGDWYRVRGVEHPEPLPDDLPLDMFILGTLLGNLMAWKRGVNFYELRRTKH